MQTNVSSWDTMKCASSARDLAEHCYLPLSHNFYITQATFWTKLEHMLPRRGNLLITTDLKFVSVVPWRLCCHLPICLPWGLITTRFTTDKRNSVPLPHNLAELNASRQEKHKIWEPLLHWCSALQCEGHTLGEQQRSQSFETWQSMLTTVASGQVWKFEY